MVNVRNFEEYRRAIASILGVGDNVNVRNFEEYRRAVLNALGFTEPTIEELRNDEKWHTKVLEGLGAMNDIAKNFELKTASGSIVSFSDGVSGVPIHSLVVDIDYNSQGWAEANVAVRGKNLFECEEINDDNWGGNASYTNFITRFEMEKETNGVSWKSANDGAFNFIFRLKKLLPNKTYTFNFKASDGNRRTFIRLFDAEGNNISSSSITISGYTYNTYFQAYFASGSPSFTIPSTASYAYVGFGATESSYGTRVYYTDIQLEFGSSASEYEEYQGEDISVAFEETVYGGLLDITNGKVISTLDSDGTTLDTPVEYELTPKEITAKDDNNIWADVGNSTVKYISVA